MHMRTLAGLAAAIGLALVPASALAAPDHTVTLSPDAATKTWTGTQTQGFNASFFDTHLPNTCNHDVQTYCDDTLVHFNSLEPFDDSNLTFRIDGFAHSDFDLRVYNSDKTGAVGDLIGTGTGDGKGVLPLATFAGDPETVGATGSPDGYYLVRVVYFTSPGDETYTGHVSWTGGFTPPDEG